MKTPKNLILLAILIFAATSCDYLKSFYPFFSEDTVVDIDALQGKYELKWEREDKESSSYILKISDLIAAVDSNKAKKKYNELAITENLILSSEMAKMFSAISGEYRTKGAHNLKQIIRNEAYIFVSVPKEIEKKGIQNADDIQDIALQIMVPIKLADKYYFDVFAYSGSLTAENGSRYSYMTNNQFNVGIHRIAQFDLSYGRLSWSYMENAFLMEGLSQNRFKLDHLKRGRDGQLLVTAATEDLQEFVIKHANDDDAFDDQAMIMERVTDLIK